MTRISRIGERIAPILTHARVPLLGTDMKKNRNTEKSRKEDHGSLVSYPIVTADERGQWSAKTFRTSVTSAMTLLIKIHHLATSERRNAPC